MNYNYKKTNQYLLLNTRPQDAKNLEALQRKVFPTLSAEELISEQHYLHHLEVFPEGQFVVMDGDRLIAMTSTMRTNHALDEDHTFLEISDNLWLNTHDPRGVWLYGMDMGVDPEYRGQGIARALYRARQELCRKLGLKGQFTVGMLNGYLPYRNELTIDEYGARVLSGEQTDPTITPQQKIGFTLVRLMKNYLNDPQCGNAGVLMVLDAAKEV
ncbi:MAG: GNAT family N-acetyltransferase [Saprospiraceae bacterium]|nr:GNAT family N-acetyltransferase [Saprospiraceae bacterium]